MLDLHDTNCYYFADVLCVRSAISGPSEHLQVERVQIPTHLMSNYQVGPVFYG